VTSEDVRHRQRATAPGTVVRVWSDLALIGVGVAVLVLSALPIDADSVPGWEQGIFRAINDHTVAPFVAVWVAMQLGNVVIVPIAAAAAALTRRWRLAIGLLVGGLAAYLLAKQVKDVMGRGRPSALLDDVVIRGDVALGRGYVSGHAAIAPVLAVVAWPYLGQRWRVVVVVAASLVILARVYVGAHLPLDVVGGVGLGLALGGMVRVLLGRSSRRRPGG